VRCGFRILDLTVWFDLDEEGFPATGTGLVGHIGSDIGDQITFISKCLRIIRFDDLLLFDLW
jgi:hypothetical protein